MENTKPIPFSDLWKTMVKKFSVEVANDFSKQDVTAYATHFLPNSMLTIFQYGEDASGKLGKGKHLKIYTGGLFSSLLKGRIPYKLMAKVAFKRLRIDHYSHSKIYVLGIAQNPTDSHQIRVLNKFERFNTSGEIFKTSLGIYSLQNTSGKWYINEISIYDDTPETAKIFANEAFTSLK